MAQIGAVIDPLQGAAGAACAVEAPKVATRCGAPLHKRVHTLVAGGHLCTANTLLSVGGTEEFQLRVMQRTESGAAANAAAAERFFAEHYGLDFSATEWRNGAKTIDGAEMIGFQLNPKLQLRVYSMSSTSCDGQQPLGSVKVWQGGWMARTTCDGHVFGGAFGASDKGRCRPYPVGTIVLFGDYRLQGFEEHQTLQRVCAADGTESVRVHTHVAPKGRATIVTFSSRSPLIADTNDRLVFDNALVTETGQRGTATGVLTITPAPGSTDGGEVDVDGTEVWVFRRHGAAP